MNRNVWLLFACQALMNAVMAGQVIMESLLFSLLAMLLSVGLIRVIGLLYYYATGASLTGALPLMLRHYGWLLLFSLAVGLLAGIYPVLTALKPILSLKPLTSRTGRSNPRMRNILAKLDARDRTHAVTIAMRRGFIDN